MTTTDTETSPSGRSNPGAQHPAGAAAFVELLASENAAGLRSAGGFEG